MARWVFKVNMDTSFIRLFFCIVLLIFVATGCSFFSSAQEDNTQAVALATVQQLPTAQRPTVATATRNVNEGERTQPSASQAVISSQVTPTRLLAPTALPNRAQGVINGTQAVAEVVPAANLPDRPLGAELGSQAIYRDGLAPGWQNWSWQATVEFSAKAPAGNQLAIAVTYQAAWAGLRLHRDELIATADADLLRFRIHGGQIGGQKVRVVLADSGNVLLEQGVTVTAVANAWTAVEIKLSDLGNIAHLSGIVWQDATGETQPTFYLDQIALVDISLPPTATPVPLVGPALTVDVTTPRHPINPDIYGINFAEEALAEALALPVRRWGGNGTTRYNWQLDTASHTKDWFFENIPKENADPAALPFGSQADLFVEQDQRTGTRTLMTMPLIGWTPKSRAYACGFSVAKYGSQQQVDPWRTDCGNGITPAGEFITSNDPTDTSLPIDERFVQAWLEHLTGRFGTAAAGGVAYYSLDNEPMLWHETHRDVHPEPVSYDELRDRTYQYAAVIKRMDPTAQTLGPALWGWTAYSYSAFDQASGSSWWNNAADRQAHDNVPLVSWYLQQMQAYENANGLRLLDYLDLHYYPQGRGVALAGAGNRETQALRLRSTRSLWDANYRDESWIGEAVRLIPRMQMWVEQSYPGTKVALTEYNWGGLDHINGAVAQADILGIFGREGLDMAMLWDPADAHAPFAHAFRIYRNYDGQGGQFGDLSLDAQSSDQEQLAIYAARRQIDQALTVVVVNKSFSTLRSTMRFAGLNQATAAHYQYSAAELTAIVRLADQSMNDTLTMDFPEQSISLFVIH